MADSNITKRALATSLKELMMEQPFEKINVAQICERCNMNRKSFYYHFKDKYDLVNWIFDTEFIALLKDENLSSNYKEQPGLQLKIPAGYFYQESWILPQGAADQGPKLLCRSLPGVHPSASGRPHFPTVWAVG